MLMEANIPILPFKDIPDFKQVMLYKKYLKYIPPEFQQNELYRKPTNEVVACVTEDNSARKEQRKQKSKNCRVRYTITFFKITLNNFQFINFLISFKKFKKYY